MGTIYLTSRDTSTATAGGATGPDTHVQCYCEPFCRINCFAPCRKTSDIAGWCNLHHLGQCHRQGLLGSPDGEDLCDSGNDRQRLVRCGGVWQPLCLRDFLPMVSLYMGHMRAPVARDTWSDDMKLLEALH